MKSLNTLLLLLIIIFFTGCKKESDTTTLMVTVQYKYFPSGVAREVDAQFWPVKGASVYVFKDINFSMDYVKGIYYDYLGNGKLKNKTTGVETLFYKKLITDFGFVEFENLQNGAYGVVVDILDLDKGKRLDYRDCWAWVSTDVPGPILPGIEPNKLHLEFDIWPWMPWDIAK